MPCATGGSTEPLTTGQPVQDWAGVHVYTPQGIFQPKTRADIVAVVRKIEETSSAKAVGSVFSLSRAPDSDGFVIGTNSLNKHLSQPFPMPSVPMKASRFATSVHNAQWLATLARPGFPSTGSSLIHVQAGIRIKELIADLASVGLAVPTMGAGGGQTVAGALSTSTHGSDVNLRLLGDAVRTIHLVGPGGQEWWIEPSAGPGVAIGYSQLPDWCPDTKIIRDSDFLESVIVGVGRFGVIYSMVLEVVSQYRLEEHRGETNWADVHSALLTAVAGGYTTPGNVFADPRGGSPLRFWSVVIDAASGSDAYLQKRWITTNTDPEGLDKGFDALGFLCTNQSVAVDVVILATTAAVQALDAIAKTIGIMFGPIPVVGPILATEQQAPYLGLAADLMDAAINFTTLGDFIATVIDRVRSWSKEGPGFAHGAVEGIVDDLLKNVWSTILANDQVKPHIRRGLSNEILDTHNYKLDGCLSVDSSEFFFDATKGSYLQFVDAVLQTAKVLGPIMGIVSLRFVRQTISKIGMQRFDRTVAIEVALQKPGSINKQYIKAVHSLALAHGGIPHWGQEHKLTEAQVEQLYGSDLETWRWALSETESTIAGTFSSKFTRNRGLEPRDSLSTYRARRYVGAAVSSP